MEKLTESKINEALKRLNGWKFAENRLQKEYVFEDFSSSVDFINSILPVANSMNHHPDVCISYNRVNVLLTTHDAGGVTQKDLELAEKIDRLIKSKQK